MSPFLTVVQKSSNYTQGDPLLKPEKANQFDLALIGDVENARFQLSGFASIVVDDITFEVLPAAMGPDEVKYTHTHTNATLAGGEASGEFDVTKTWTPFFNLSDVDGRDQVRDEPLPSLFPFQTRLGLRWHDPDRKHYGVEFAARVVNQQNRVSTHLGEPRTPGFTTFDLRSHWQANHYLRLNVGIENITNKTFPTKVPHRACPDGSPVSALRRIAINFGVAQKPASHWGKPNGVVSETSNKNYLEHLNVHNPAVSEPGTSFYLSAQLDY